MSNLYKQWFTRTDENNTRVINSNAIMVDRMEKVRRQPADGEAQEGFMEGLFASDGSNVIHMEEEVDHVQLAKDEAESILADAQAQADELVGQAQKDAVEIEEAARNRGYEEGSERAQNELDASRSQLEAEYQQRRQQLDDDYTEKRKNMEKDLVDVILEVFNKVFHIQFDNKKEILMYLIENAILGIEGEKKFRIRVAGANSIFLENSKEEILDRVGHNIELEILADFTMDGNDCVIETDSGVFDCSLGVQLENLIKDIRSLCS